MGYLVLQSYDNEHFDIIDGQQRMTTISMMILAGLSYLPRPTAKWLHWLCRSCHPHSSIKTPTQSPNDPFDQTYLVPLKLLSQ